MSHELLSVRRYNQCQKFFHDIQTDRQTECFIDQYHIYIMHTLLLAIGDQEAGIKS
jgi:hypothetical protein